MSGQQNLSAINAAAFPHIDLNEQSSRPGVNGPRYVPVDGGRVLGDTNTGLHVFPVNCSNAGQTEQFQRAVARSERFRQEREALYGGD